MLATGWPPSTDGSRDRTGRGQHAQRGSPERSGVGLHIHGTRDRMVPFGGGVGERSLTRVIDPPVREVIDRWRGYARCDGCADGGARAAVDDRDLARSRWDRDRALHDRTRRPRLARTAHAAPLDRVGVRRHAVHPSLLRSSRASELRRSHRRIRDRAKRGLGSKACSPVVVGRSPRCGGSRSTSARRGRGSRRSTSGCSTRTSPGSGTARR